MDMGGSELGVIAAVVVGGLVQLGVSLALFLWGRWVARRRAGGLWRAAAWAPIVACVLAIVGAVVGTVLLVRGFASIANAEPTQKATVLARSISESTNVMAFF